MNLDDNIQHDDEALVRQARRGDGASLGALLSRYYPSLLRLCRRLLVAGPEAEDVAQEAALAAFETTGFDPAGAQAVDLGCGDGTETMALLAKGWRVLAVEREPAAIKRVLATVPEEARPRLETQVASFEDVALPGADFIYAGVSLPFCPAADFPAVWERVMAAVRPGGRFAGHLFGERDRGNTRPPGRPPAAALHSPEASNSQPSAGGTPARRGPCTPRARGGGAAGRGRREARRGAPARR